MTINMTAFVGTNADPQKACDQATEMFNDFTAEHGIAAHQIESWSAASVVTPYDIDGVAGETTTHTITVLYEDGEEDAEDEERLSYEELLDERNTLLEAAQFSHSVHCAQGQFDVSERQAVQKLAEAIAFAGHDPRNAKAPELPQKHEVFDLVSVSVADMVTKGLSVRSQAELLGGVTIGLAELQEAMRSGDKQGVGVQVVALMAVLTAGYEGLELADVVPF